MKITLHHCHEARSMRSLWLLNELGLEFELVIHPFYKLRTEVYLGIHPLGRVPALQVDDMILYESGAITQYLCEHYSPEKLGRTSNHPERVEWLQWLHYAETIAVHCASLVQQNIIIQDKALRSPLIIKLETKRLEKSLEVLDSTLKKNDYLLASGFCAVDIAVGYSIFIAKYFIDLSDFPIVNEYYGRLSSRKAFQKSLPDVDEPLKIFK